MMRLLNLSGLNLHLLTFFPIPLSFSPGFQGMSPLSLGLSILSKIYLFCGAQLPAPAKLATTAPARRTNLPATLASFRAPGPSASTSPHVFTGHLTCNSDTVPTKCHFRRNKKRRDKRRLLAGLPKHQPLCRASSHLNLLLPHITIWRLQTLQSLKPIPEDTANLWKFHQSTQF